MINVKKNIKKRANSQLADLAVIIESELPQTQCTLCTYDGCKPYAKAIAEKNERIDLCLPGGVKVMRQLGKKLGQPTKHLEEDLQSRQRAPSYAVINEDDCIGCTKCIQACPVDAIIGRNKKMHRIIEKDCTGCELCIAPCPTDCISMAIKENYQPSDRQSRTRANHAKNNYESRNSRLEKDFRQEKQRYAAKKDLRKNQSLVIITGENTEQNLDIQQLQQLRQKQIADAIAKKARQRQLNAKPNLNNI